MLNSVIYAYETKLFSQSTNDVKSINSSTTRRRLNYRVTKSLRVSYVSDQSTDIPAHIINPWQNAE